MIVSQSTSARGLAWRTNQHHVDDPSDEPEKSQSIGPSSYEGWLVEDDELDDVDVDVVFGEEAVSPEEAKRSWSFVGIIAGECGRLGWGCCYTDKQTVYIRQGDEQRK